MGRSDDLVWAAILGGLAGSALAAPKPEEKRYIDAYKLFKTQIDIKKAALGPLPNLEKIRKDSVVYNSIVESINLYLYGFNRACSVSSAATLEFALKQKYGDNPFNQLIDLARKDNLISEGEMHYLHGIRIDRNERVHNLSTEVREQDSIMILQLTIRLLDKIL